MSTSLSLLLLLAGVLGISQPALRLQNEPILDRIPAQIRGRALSAEPAQALQLILEQELTHTHTPTHTDIYIYISMTDLHT